MLSILAYRLQAEMLGDLDKETLRFLERIGLSPSGSAVVPMAQAFEQRQRSLPSGTVLTREWNGHQHRVFVSEAGFLWEEKSYKSLSEIAKAITGTNWNGPRFFGLRSKKKEGSS